MSALYGRVAAGRYHDVFVMLPATSILKRPGGITAQNYGVGELREVKKSFSPFGIGFAIPRLLPFSMAQISPQTMIHRIFTRIPDIIRGRNSFLPGLQRLPGCLFVFCLNGYMNEGQKPCLR